MTDLALNIAIRAQDMTSGIMSNLSNAFGNILFGLRNIGTEGTLTSDAFAAAGGQMGSALMGIGVAATVAGAAIAVGIGVQSVKAAAQYQQSMNMVQALTGSNADQMKQYDADLKALAVDAGVAPNDLAKGLYNVLSASYSGSQAMQVLTLATQDAKIGMTSAATTTNALTTVLKAFSVQGKDFTVVNGEMISTVTLGKMTMEQYAGSIGKASTTSMQFHVSMENMNASIATMTSNGIPSAAQAVTDYNQLLTTMYGKVDTVAKSLAKNGIAFNETAFNAASYSGKIQMLNVALQQATDKHIHITGVTMQAAQAVQILSQHSGEYATDLATLSNRQQMAVATQNAWSITQSGFSQQMSRVSAAVQVLFINIGTALLPTLTKLAAQVTPMILAFADWLVKSGALQASINILAGTVTILVTIVGGLATALSNTIKFFQQNQLAGDILIGVMTGIAVAIGVAVIPGLIAAGITAVASFGAWAVAAGAAAIATLAVTWPFLLIAAIVAVVVVGIILAIQHWGEISKWLQGVWSGIASFFTGLWHGIQGVFGGIGQWFHDRFQQAHDGVQSAWGNTGNWFQDRGKDIQKSWTQTTTSVGEGAIWLYHHNYYVQAFVDQSVKLFHQAQAWIAQVWATITADVGVAVAWIQSEWAQFTGWIGAQWNHIASLATSLWNYITSLVMHYVDMAIAWLQSQWTAASTWLQDQWNKVAGMASAMWAQVSAVFSSIWNTYIAGPLGSLWNQFTTWFGNIATQFYQSGVNFINMLVQGILSGAGQIWSAVQNIAGQIWAGLGFHSPPPAGPLADSDQYMPNFIAMLAAGLNAGIPTLSTATNNLALPLTSLGTGASSSAVPATSAASGHTFNITVNAPGRSRNDSQDIANTVKAELAKILRGQAIAPRYTSGG